MAPVGMPRARTIAIEVMRSARNIGAPMISNAAGRTRKSSASSIAALDPGLVIAGWLAPSAADPPRQHHERHDQQTDGNCRLRNGERNVGSQAALVELYQLVDRGPGEPDQDVGGDQKQKLAYQRERQSYGFRQ